MTLPLRRWQQEFGAALQAHDGPNFLLNAAPGAGKTIAAGSALSQMRSRLGIERLIVVCPTKALRRQWAHALFPWGFELDADFSNANASIAPDMDGVVVTYQTVVAQPALFQMFCQRRRTVVVLDEIHHAGHQRAWGSAVLEAFGDAVLRLGLSGTPFRGDRAAIPFVTYDDGGLAKPDFDYGYGASLRDGVCREVRFVLRDADVTWEYAGEQISATFADAVHEVDAARRLATVVSPACDYMTEVLDEADEKLTQLRRVKPDAAGLVLAETKLQAREIARLLEARTGTAPKVVLSDDKQAGDTIAEFSETADRWIVAVRMISEGTDIPRLAVEVWATRWRAELFFRQAVGRVVRKQRTDPPRFVSTVYLPADPTLRQLASRLQDEVKYQVDEGLEPIEDVELKTDGPRDDQFVPIGATPGDHEIIVAGRRYTPAQVEHARKIMGAVGGPDSDLAETLEQLSAAGVLPSPSGETPAPRTEPRTAVKKRLRQEIDQLARELGSIRELCEPDFDWRDVRGPMNKYLGISTISAATEDDLVRGVSYLKVQLERLAGREPRATARVVAERAAKNTPSYLADVRVAPQGAAAREPAAFSTQSARPQPFRAPRLRRPIPAVRAHIRPAIGVALRPGAPPLARRMLISQLAGDPGVRAASLEARQALIDAARRGDPRAAESALQAVERSLADAGASAQSGSGFAPGQHPGRE